MGIGKHLKVMLYNLHDQKVVRDLQLFFLRARITQMVEDGASDEELAEKIRRSMDIIDIKPHRKGDSE